VAAEARLETSGVVRGKRRSEPPGDARGLLLDVLDAFRQGLERRARPPAQSGRLARRRRVRATLPAELGAEEPDEHPASDGEQPRAKPPRPRPDTNAAQVAEPSELLRCDPDPIGLTAPAKRVRCVFEGEHSARSERAA